MNNKILYGLKNSKLIILDIDVSEEAKKHCFREGCTSVVVADRSQRAIDCIVSGNDVTMDMFEGVVL